MEKTALISSITLCHPPNADQLFLILANNRPNRNPIFHLDPISPLVHKNTAIYRTRRSLVWPISIGGNARGKTVLRWKTGCEQNASYVLNEYRSNPWAAQPARRARNVRLAIRGAGKVPSPKLRRLSPIPARASGSPVLSNLTRQPEQERAQFLRRGFRRPGEQCCCRSAGGRAP
jgi:hypothetical protein